MNILITVTDAEMAQLDGIIENRNRDFEAAAKAEFDKQVKDMVVSPGTRYKRVVHSSDIKRALRKELGVKSRTAMAKECFIKGLGAMCSKPGKSKA